MLVLLFDFQLEEQKERAQQVNEVGSMLFSQLLLLCGFVGTNDSLEKEA